MTDKTKKLTALLTAAAVTVIAVVCSTASQGQERTAAEAPTRSYVVLEFAPRPTTTAAKPTASQEPVSLYSDFDVELIGRTIWGEAGGVASKAERAAVAWCILNRVDARGDSIANVVTEPHQFQGYRPADIWGECPQEHLDLAADVLNRWAAERRGATSVGRVLPADYLYFMGDGAHNHFTTEWLGSDTWDWSLDNPYQ